MSLGIVADFIKGAKEKLTGFLGVMSSDHAYIHQGKAYTAIISAGSISAAYDICFRTPRVSDGKFIHWRPLGITTSADYVGYQLTEAETYTGGTSATPINRNRPLALSDPVKYSSKMQDFVYNATCTPAGTVIDAGGMGTSGVGTAKAGGKDGADEELILNPDTVYCLTLTPAGATTVTAKLFFYEEEGYKA